MCTAISYRTRDRYFGRTLDLEFSYHESVTVTPRNYPFRFRWAAPMVHHYAIIGMAFVQDDYPLYYDAVNEKGIGMAGLNFPGNAFYAPAREERDNIAPFEFIPWVLGQCATMDEVRALLGRLNVANASFSEQLPASPLHWMISGPDGSVVVESMRDGVKVHENPIGVMTNNPPFDVQMTMLSHTMSLSIDPPVNRLAPDVALDAYSRGMGAMGLPGDLSSASRFARAAFTKLHSVAGESESESVSQFFHILGAVAQQRGCVRMPDGRYEITVYTSCCNADRGVYYYTTYENSQITAVDMHREDLDGHALASYPLIQGQQIRMQN